MGLFIGTEEELARSRKMADKKKREDGTGPFGMPMPKSFSGSNSSTDAPKPKNKVYGGMGGGGGGKPASDDNPIISGIKRAGEVASTAVLTGGASLAPMLLGGDSYRPKPQQGPAAPAKPKSRPARAPAAVTKTTITSPTKTYGATAAAVKPRAQKGPLNWRGDDSQPVKFQKAIFSGKRGSGGGASHDFSGLKGFFRGKK